MVQYVARVYESPYSQLKGETLSLMLYKYQLIDFTHLVHCLQVHDTLEKLWEIRLEGRSPKKLKSLIETSNDVHVKVHVLSFNMILISSP